MERPIAGTGAASVNAAHEMLTDCRLWLLLRLSLGFILIEKTNEKAGMLCTGKLIKPPSSGL